VRRLLRAVIPFVLSGFIMAMTYGSMFARHYSWASHEEFLLRRIGRIYPLYLVVTLAISSYSIAMYGGFDHVHRPAIHLHHPLLAHLTNLLMIQAWGFGDAIGGPTWSISAEWLAYLLFPLLVWLTLSSGRTLAFVIGCLAYGALIYVAVTPEAHEAARNNRQLDVYNGNDSLLILRCLGGFCLGLLTFRVRTMPQISRWVFSDQTCCAIALGLSGMMAAARNDLMIYPLFPLLVLSLYGNRGRAARILSGRLFYTLGVLSYSLYLVHDHFIVLREQLQKQFQLHMPPLWANSFATIITYCLIFGVTTLTYRFVEKPGRIWFQRLARRLHTTSRNRT
jgi:peptidoglycan/LPS O-acetylase OafA/YrhL